MSPGSQLAAIESSSVADSAMPMSAERISVCHLASGDRWAGAEVQLATLLKALARRTDLGVSAVFLNEGDLADEARRCGIEVCVVPESQHNFCQLFFKAARFLRGKHIDILHSHRYKENILAALLARRCRIPFHVCSMHGAPEPFAGLRRYKRGLIESLDRMVERYSADSIVSVSGELARELSRQLPKSKVTTVYNGIDPERVSSALSVSEAKQRLGIPAERWVIGTAGRLEPIKRLDIFLLAARQILAGEPNVSFVIAGEGSQQTRLLELARALGVEDHTLFLGHRSDIYDILRAMDIFVLCSDHEGLPMALLETLYLEVPVVARPVGGIPEVIEDGVNGVLVDSSGSSALAEQCLRLLADEDRRRQLAQAGRRRVAEDFAVEKTADKMAQLYRSLGDVR